MQCCSECGRNPHTHQGRFLAGGKESCASAKADAGASAGASASASAGASASSSTDGMVCSTWGPPRWFSLHMTTFGYPVHPTDTQKENMQNLIRMWEHELPCCCCRNNYNGHVKHLLKKNNKTDKFCKAVESRQTLVQFGFDLHNAVNKALGKYVLNTVDLERVCRMYESCRAGLAKDHAYAHATITLRHPEDMQHMQHKINNTNVILNVISIDTRCVLNDTNCAGKTTEPASS